MSDILNAIISNLRAKITAQGKLEEIKIEIIEELIQKRETYPQLADTINNLIEEIDLSNSKTDLENILETKMEKFAKTARDRNLARNK